MMDVRLDVFDGYEQTLIETKNFKQTLELELKDEEGKFEEYNPNWLFLRAIKWEEGLDYDYSKPDSFPSAKIKVDPLKQKVGDLEEQVSAALDIPVQNLIILLRHEHGYNSTSSTEYYNMEWRRPKIIKDVSKLDHGKVLFCEYGEHGAAFNPYKWQQEFA